MGKQEANYENEADLWQPMPNFVVDWAGLKVKDVFVVSAAANGFKFKAACGGCESQTEKITQSNLNGDCSQIS